MDTERLHEDCLRGLNPAQRRAVLHDGSHLLIVAGPGTGKTHTLVSRIRRVCLGLPPGRGALAVAFTNKAGLEIAERLAHGPTAEVCRRRVTVGTSHRLCLGFLRRWARRAGLPRDFVLATPEWIDPSTGRIWPGDSAAERRRRLEAIRRWKADPLSPPPEGAEAYQRFLRKHGRLDFDDLLRETHRLLADDPGIRASLSRRYPHVFVDEYQDVNAVQQAILFLLIEAGAVVTAIGDPRQAIYGFRGADPASFDRFLASFPETETLTLETNYRNSPNLLTASSQVMEAADTVTPPSIAALMEEGTLVVHTAPTDRAEAEYVVHQVERLVGGTSLFSQDSGRVAADAEAGWGFGDVAVLYRLNALRPPLEEAFDRSGIPYQVAGDRPLRGRPWGPVMLTLMALLSGRRVSWASVRDLLGVVAPGLGMPSDDHDRIRAGDLPRIIEVSGLGEGPAAVLARGVAECVRRPMSWRERFRIWEETSCGRAFLGDAGRRETWKTLLRTAEAFDRPRDFFDVLDLQREEETDERIERVHLMTLHAAKGLEFPVVFIVGCEEGLLPLGIAGREADIEEERRLFYVGMTRAGRRLHLVSALRRRVYGREWRLPVSSFVKEIEEDLKAYETARCRRRKPEGDQLSLF